MARRAPRQQALKLAAPGVTSGYEVIFVPAATIAALPESAAFALLPHMQEDAGHTVFVHDCDEARRALARAPPP